MRFLRVYVFHNFALKLMSLLLAVLLWWAVARDPRVEIALSVPIEFHNVPNELEISSEKVPQAEIRVRGPARVVRELSSADIHPVLDLQGAGIGEKTFDLTQREIRLDHDLEVVQVVPAQFRVSLDRRTSREVDVHARVIGTFASGFRILETITDPKKITIIGPDKRVNSIESAITDPVDATGVIGRATFTTNAYIADPLVRVAKPVPIHVTVVTEKHPGKPGAP
jgi:YbbR domain-containing protein